MLYAIISQDVENSLEKRKRARPDHVARLNRLQDQGRLILAGPHPSIDVSEPGEAGFSGSLIVAQFDGLEEARDWAEAAHKDGRGIAGRCILQGRFQGQLQNSS